MPPLKAVWRSRILRTALQRRFMTPAPRPGDGPLMQRRADRALPDLSSLGFRWSRTLPLFLLSVSAAALAIFNYQKTSSPIIAASLYALRTSPRARALLGDDVSFRDPLPWISGTIDQVHGHVDVAFAVKGSSAQGTMRFRSVRPTPRGLYHTQEWSLTMQDGEYVDLMQGHDPFVHVLAEVEEQSVRGFRQVEVKPGGGL